MMKNILFRSGILFASLFIFLSMGCTSGGEKGMTSVIVVTGGHDYDTVEFIAMFEAMKGVDYELAIKPDVWKMLEEGRKFDALVFYDLWQEISEEEKQIFLNEFARGAGMVFLHHSLVSHQEWPEYTHLVGGKYFQPEFTSEPGRGSDYKHDISMKVRVLDANHPVTAGVKDFEIFDEGYSNTLMLTEVHPLLETSHPNCDRYVGWTHMVNNSRVVYLMGGHDKQAYENESFCRLVNNAIRWTGAKRDH
ncbi:ThuA domain-containing protein [Bacteroidota bacterium]